MYGNTGEKWVQIKALSLNGLKLNRVGEEFSIGEYYSVPHGYTSIKHDNCLLYFPDDIFESHFVRLEVYEQYLKKGDSIMVNANGLLSKYTIEGIAGNSYYVNLSLKREFEDDNQEE